MVETAEAVGDVTFDEPRCSAPPRVDRLQGGVTATAGPEPVGVVGELRLVVRLQQQAQYFLQQLVRPGRQSQRAFLVRPFLLDVDPPRRSPPVALRTERVD